MSTRIYYEPILRMKEGFGKKDTMGQQEHFRVNGAANEDYDEAVRLASKHISVRDGEAEIIRVDKIEAND